jgi:hypothetical protein
MVIRKMNACNRDLQRVVAAMQMEIEDRRQGLHEVSQGVTVCKSPELAGDRVTAVLKTEVRICRLGPLTLLGFIRGNSLTCLALEAVQGADLGTTAVTRNTGQKCDGYCCLPRLGGRDARSDASHGHFCGSQCMRRSEISAGPLSLVGPLLAADLATISL